VLSCETPHPSLWTRATHCCAILASQMVEPYTHLSRNMSYIPYDIESYLLMYVSVQTLHLIIAISLHFGGCSYLHIAILLRVLAFLVILLWTFPPFVSAMAGTCKFNV
jgi:hypothetical protein